MCTPPSAIADRTARKKELLAGFAWSGAAFASLLFLVTVLVVAAFSTGLDFLFFAPPPPRRRAGGGRPPRMPKPPLSGA